MANNCSIRKDAGVIDIDTIAETPNANGSFLAIIEKRGKCVIAISIFPQK